ncbi:Rho GTPase-activating protein 29 [Halotydeus destructor]|nr:Rho GTPase-activating protein 29 [Halotydeus destructor]
MFHRITISRTSAGKEKKGKGSNQLYTFAPFQVQSSQSVDATCSGYRPASAPAGESSSSSTSNPGPSSIRSLIKRLERAPKLEIQETSTETSSRPSTKLGRRRRRSLHLPESFSDGETDGSGLLRTSSFCDKNSKKWSLPVPSTASRNSEGSESTTTSFSSRSSGVESLSGAEITSADGSDMSSTGATIVGPDGEVVLKRSKRWSKAAQTHSFAKIYSYVFERCRTCDTYIYLSGFKCDKCNLYSHSKCLKRSIIICDQRPRPKKLTPVFGQPLSTVAEDVPYIVVKCCTEIEKRGYCIKGIYRVNGAIGRVRKLVRSLEFGPCLIDISEAHPNDLSNVLKEYFRLLPEPIFTSELYTSFISIGKQYRNTKEEDLATEKDKIVADILAIVAKLPDKHRTCVSFLMHHLKFIADNREINQMSAKNLGLVFAPTLFRMKDPEGKHYLMLFDNSFQALIIELLITYCYEVFGPPPKIELFNFG